MNEQSNTQEGIIQVIANEALTDKEGLLAVLTEDTNVLEAKLPDAVTDLALFVIEEGAAAGAYASLRPLYPNRNVRIRLNGTCNPGDILKLHAIDATNDGKVAPIGSTPGIYFSPGVAEEEGVDEQLVLVRPMPRLVSVNSAHVADPAACAAMTATLTGVDTGTDMTAAQAGTIVTDLAALKAGIDANNAAIDAINVALAEQKVTAAS